MTHSLTLRFDTEEDRRTFIAFWLEHEYLTNLYAVCDPNATSWIADEPELRLMRSEDEDLFGRLL